MLILLAALTIACVLSVGSPHTQQPQSLSTDSHYLILHRQQTQCRLQSFIVLNHSPHTAMLTEEQTMV